MASRIQTGAFTRPGEYPLWCSSGRRLFLRAFSVLVMSDFITCSCVLSDRGSFLVHPFLLALSSACILLHISARCWSVLVCLLPLVRLWLLEGMDGRMDKGWPTS